MIDSYGNDAHQEVYAVLTQGALQVQDSISPSISHSDVNASKGHSLSTMKLVLLKVMLIVAL